jgi:cobalt-zinc-cadmium efflux system membrane fusion protein
MRSERRVPWKRILILAVFLGLSLDRKEPVQAHEGEQHGTPAPGAASSGGPVTLTQEARKNLGLETSRVETRALIVGPTGFGQVEPLPGKLFVISARISGRATQVFKVPGDPVRAGERVVEVESRVVADPPVRITLPSRIAGTVIDRSIEAGQPVDPDQSLLTVADLSRVLFRIEVFEVDFGTVAVGQGVEARFESYPERTFSGTIRRLGSVADPETRTIPVWAEIDNADRSLRINMRGSARVVTRETGPVIAVPRNAVLGDAANRFVYLDTGPAFVPTPVTLGVEEGGWVEITSGLIPGDEIVTRGSYELQYVTTPAAPDSVAGHGRAPAVPEGKKRGRFGC